MTDIKLRSKRELKNLLDKVLSQLKSGGASKDTLSIMSSLSIAVDVLWRDPYTMRSSGFAVAGGPDAVISWSDVSRTFTIEPFDPEYENYTPRFAIYSFRYSAQYYRRYEAETLQLPDEEGLYMIYFAADETTRKQKLQYTKNPDVEDIQYHYQHNILVAWLYWKADTSEAIYFGDSRHGSEFIPAMHWQEHQTLNALRQSGLGITNAVFDGDGSDNGDYQFTISSGEVWFGDILKSITGVGVATEVPVWYFDASGYPRFTTQSGKKFLTAGSGRAAYLNAGAITEATSGYFVVYHLFATNDTLETLISVISQDQYDTLGSAMAAVEAEVADLRQAMPHSNMMHITSAVFQTSDDYTNSAKTRLVALVQDVVTDMSVVGTGSPTNPIKLKNDEEEPGASKYYGTDENEEKGYHELPTGGGDYLWNLFGFTGETISPPSNIQVNANGSGSVVGTVAEGDVHITAINSFGETTPADVPAFDVLDDTTSVVISWDAVDGATSYRMYMPGNSYYETLNTSEDILLLSPSGSGSAPSENTAYIEGDIEIENEDTVKFIGNGVDIESEIDDEDSTLKKVTITKQQSDWDEDDTENPNFIKNKPDIPQDINDLTDTEDLLGEENVQSDWNQTDTEADDFIKNKPAIPEDVGDLTDTGGLLGGEENVQSDWDQTDTEADDYIKNKPEISGSDDEKVKYNADDASNGYLSEKTVAGDNIYLLEGTDADADKLKISARASGNTHEIQFNSANLFSTSAYLKFQSNILKVTGGINLTATPESSLASLNIYTNDAVNRFKIQVGTLFTAITGVIKTQPLYVQGYTSIHLGNEYSSDSFVHIHDDTAGTPKTFILKLRDNSLNVVFGIYEDSGIYFHGQKFVSTSTGTADNDKLVTQGYVDDGDASDKRLKKSVRPIKSALSLIKKLQGVRFKWRKTKKDSIGFIAQEFEKVIPELVSENSKGYKRIDYRKLTALLVEGMKEQQAEINFLKSEIKKLK